MNIEKLIDLIKNSPDVIDFDEPEEWEDFFDRNLPGWESLIKNPANFPIIDKIKVPKNFESFCIALIEAGGIELAIHWFNSEVNKHRKASRKWLAEISETITPSIWNKLTDPMKDYIINYTFGYYPAGEPFHTYRKIHSMLTHLFALHIEHKRSSEISIILTMPLFPFLGYTPSFEIENLISVVKAANDEKYLEIIKNKIKEMREEYNRSFSLIQNLRIPYIPSKDESELIARAIEKFTSRGYESAILPEIYLSLERPPFFITYPEIEEEFERFKEKEEDFIPRKERRIPEEISIEEVLGVYIPVPHEDPPSFYYFRPHFTPLSKEHPPYYYYGYPYYSSKIILYQRGIKWFSQKYNLNQELLKSIVLLHQIGHWITHLLPKRGEIPPIWPFWNYQNASIEVHEGWAQLITWWIVKEIGGEFETTFEKFNRYVSSPYKVFEKFKEYSIDSVISSLSKIRKEYKITIGEWEKIIET